MIFGFDLPQIATGITALTALIAALSTIRRLRLESRDSIIASFQKLLEEQRKEMTLILERRQVREAELQGEITKLREAMVASKREREEQLSALALAHSQEIQAIQTESRDEARRLNDMIQEYHQTTVRQTQRIRALERQLGIEPTGVHNDRIHESRDRPTGPDRRVLPEKRGMARRGEDAPDDRDQPGPGGPDNLGRGDN
jgi:hypothetical protein